jgi:hypothetical protein
MHANFGSYYGRTITVEIYFYCFVYLCIFANMRSSRMNTEYTQKDDKAVPSVGIWTDFYFN